MMYPASDVPSLAEAIVRVCVSRMDGKAYERGRMLSILRREVRDGESFRGGEGKRSSNLPQNTSYYSERR